MKKVWNKLTGFLIVFLTIMCTSQTYNGYGETITDYEDHWAKSAIVKALELGILNGYPDGSIKPEETMTRAQFFSMINNAFGYTELMDISFADVKENAWYASVIKKAFAAGYLDPLDSYIRPDDKITREEVAIYLSAVKSLERAKLGSNISDLKSATPEGQSAILSILETKIMQGTPDNRFLPKAKIKRAEALVALTNAVAYDSGHQVYKKPGTYGDPDIYQVIRGNAIIKSGDVNLQHMTVNGNLILDEKIGTGVISLDTVVVKGSIFIYGGSNVTLKNVTSEYINVENSKGLVRLEAVGKTVIDRVTTTTDLRLVETGVLLKEDGFIAVLVQKGLARDVDVTLLRVYLEYAQIQASSIVFLLDENSKVVSMTIEGSNAKIKGKGEIVTAFMKASGVTFETKPAFIDMYPGVEAPTMVNTVTEP